MHLTVKLYHSTRLWVKGLFGKKGPDRILDRKIFAYPFRILIHPFDSFNDIKYEKMGSAGLATALLLLYFLCNILSFFGRGYTFNTNRFDRFSLLGELFYSVLLIVLWWAVNWATSTLMSGEGTVREIWIVSCYSLTPVILAGLLHTLLSNVLVYEEGVYLQLFSALGYLFMAYYMFTGLLTIHQYTALKTFISCIITVAGIILVIFLGILFFSILQQMADFVNTVFLEIMSKL